MIIGNWKMKGSTASVQALIQELIPFFSSPHSTKFPVVICPPFPYLSLLKDGLQNTPCFLGAQNCFTAKPSAATGEVSPEMLKDLGCTHVILGHSERRALFSEPSAAISEKAAAAQDFGIMPVLCVGESFEVREKGDALPWVEKQLWASLPENIDPQNLCIAYEPVWAIGTGRAAEPKNIREMHQHLRSLLKERWPSFAETIPLAYGGSVKPDNAADILETPNVDGVLVGGASLNATAFGAIIQAAHRAALHQRTG